jgi:hypothetical protein
VALGAYDFASIRSLTQEDPLGLAGGLNLYGFAGGDPVNYSDPFGLCSVHTGLLGGIMRFFDPACKTRDEAAKVALGHVRGRLGIRQTEFVGEIVKDGAGFRYTGPRPGGSTSAGVDVDVPGYEGAYHSHPDRKGYDAEHFSSGDPSDKKLADDTAKPLYVLTPRGRELRYDPDPKKKQQGTVTEIGNTRPYANPD